MTNADITASIKSLNVQLGDLRKMAHSPRPIPSEQLVLEWVSRDRREKRRKRREMAILIAVILSVGGFALFGILCAIGQVVVALS